MVASGEESARPGVRCYEGGTGFCGGGWAAAKAES